MAEVGGRAVTDALRKVTSSQAAVTNAARQAAEQLAAERQAQLEGQAQPAAGELQPEVPAQDGTNEPSQP